MLSSLFYIMKLYKSCKVNSLPHYFLMADFIMIMIMIMMKTVTGMIMLTVTIILIREYMLKYILVVRTWIITVHYF